MAEPPLADLLTGGKLRRITRWGEPVMHRKTDPVLAFDEALHSLVRDMFATMAAAQGVGLAAPQVGVGLAVFTYACPDAEDNLMVGAVCNPAVTLPEGEARRLKAEEEGCLSLPGGYQLLARPDQAICRGVDPFGQPVEVVGTGLLARCLQHETDHLNGVVFGDRLGVRARKQLQQKHDDLADQYPPDWPIVAKGGRSARPGPGSEL
ncbi:MAG: peptide deformylase [Candidatus Nanopelagicales bacterium]